MVAILAEACACKVDRVSRSRRNSFICDSRTSLFFWPCELCRRTLATNPTISRPNRATRIQMAFISSPGGLWETQLLLYRKNWPRVGRLAEETRPRDSGFNYARGEIVQPKEKGPGPAPGLFSERNGREANLPAQPECELELTRIVRRGRLTRGANWSGCRVAQLVHGRNVRVVEQVETIGDQVHPQVFA